MSHCSVKSLVEANPDFQKVKSWYTDSDVEWYDVMEDIQQYREKYEKLGEYFPGDSEKDEYLSFVSHLRKVAKKRNQKLLRRMNSKPLREAIDVYKAMLKLGYNRTQLESRVNLVKTNFINQIRFITDKIKREEGVELSIPAAIRRLGGYQKVLERAFNRLAKATADSEYEYLVNAYGEPKDDNQKKIYRDRAEYNAKEMNKVAENKERFATLVTRELANSLGLVVNHNGIEMSLEAYKDNEDEEDNQKDDTGGEGGERYIDVRVKKIMDTISTETKAFLSTIPMTDNARRIVRDDMMRPRFLDPRQIAYVLPSILRFSTSETMIADLKEAADRYPFLLNLAKKLDGVYRKEDKNYQALIYTNFKRAANLYGYIDLNKGSYRANKANTRAQGNALVRSANRNMGGTRLDPKWSIYDDGGLIVRKIQTVASDVEKTLTDYKEKLGFVNMVNGGFDKRASVNKKGKATNYPDYTEYSKLAQEKGGEAALQKFLEDNPGVVSAVTSASRGIGIDLDEYQVRNAILSPINKTTAKIIGQTSEDDHKGTNRLVSIIDELISVYNEAARTEKKDSDKLKHKTARDVGNVVSKEFTKLNSAFAVSFFDELEPRVLVESTSLQTYIYPSLIHDTMDGLNNEAQLDETEYNEFLDKEYLRYEDMTLAGKPTGWLKRLRDGSAFKFAGKEGQQAGPYKLVHMTAFNHVEYKDLSIPQKIAAQLVMWGSMNRAVECLIQADYANAWDFIQNAGIEPGTKISELDEIIEQRVNEEIAKFREVEGKAPSFNQKVRIRTRIQNQVTAQYGKIKRPDGTYNTQWPVVQEIADEVMIEINRIARLRDELYHDSAGVFGPRMKVYDKQGLKFQIFPELNDNSFYEKYHAIKSDVDAREFVEVEVAKQLEKRIEKDFAYLEKTKALTNPQLMNFSVDNKTVNIYSSTGKIKDLESAAALLTLQNFFLDYYYGRIQMVKLMNGGLQQFKGLLDFEKRNMMNHATRRPVYTEAYWNGEKVGRENQNAIYLEDEISESYYYDDISEMLTELKNLDYIDDKHLERYIASYKDNTSTDGQAFRYYPSYRVVQIELGKWDDERERVYDYLMYGKGELSQEEISKEMRRIYNPNEKPVYTGWEIVNNVRVPVLHKYSETVLFPEHVLRKLMGDNIPAQILGMAKAAAKLNTANNPFDIFLTHSCVKVGAHTLLDPFGFEEDEDGKRILDENGHPIRKCISADQIARHITEGVKASPWAVHVLPMKYYGEAASTPAHGEDDEISWSSQAQKDIWGNIEADDELIDKRLKIDGRQMKSSEARDIDDEIDAASAAAHYKELQEIFDDPDELRDVLMTELAGKSYNSPELEFAINSGKVPYFYPSIARGAEQLFSSIIKKRMTRPKTKGANMLQVTSLGWDMDPFGNSFGLNDKHKLHIRFEGNGKDKRIKYIECYMPIHDSRLEIFADENGEITPERLQELLDKKIIPEDLIQFIAYRTPSDDIHSILPLRVVGFTSKARGANIIVPKEVMKMTGHDFDGDKLRCHFQDFNVDVSDDYLYQKYMEEQAKDENIVKAALGEDNAVTQRYQKFKKEWLANPDNYTEGIITMYQYDYSKKAHENTQEQRDNAKVQLAFAQLTSPSGSRRMLIPGGSADTDVYGATFHITRALHDDSSLEDKLEGYGIDFTDDVTIYKSLRAMSGKKLSEIMDIVNGNVVPFSFEHSNEAFDYMMGGKKMISVYALYASAGQMLQRLGLKVNQGRYYNKKTKKIESYNIGFFGKPIDDLYKIVNNAGQLGSLTQSGWINSAVDNGKNPRLGYLNQDPKLAEITNYLAAVNLSEEQVHLILNQPVIIETVRRMKEQNISFKNAMLQIKKELTANKKNLTELGYLRGSADRIFKLKEDDWIRMMPLHYEELLKANPGKAEDEQLLGNQIGILSVLLNQNKYAMLLSKVIKGTRPEATSNGIGSVLAKTMVVTSELKELRGRIVDNELDEEDIIENEDEQVEKAENEKDIPEIKQLPLLEGIKSVVAPVEVYDDDSEADIAEKLAVSPIKRITALEALMQDKVYRFFAPYFPYAKKQWRTVLDNIVGRFRASQREKEAIYRNVGNEMVLWNLMKSSAFIQNVHEEGKELVINFPKKFMQFADRVKREKYRMEKNEPALDEAARSMVNNIFIDKLSVDEPQGESEKPRLFFQKGGVTMDNFGEKITYDWAMMSVSPFEEIRKMAIDLFKYNAFTSGFGYGMYEFAHFAPYTVLEQVPGYLDALNAMRDNAQFTDTAKDGTNFFLQLHANHWGDQRLVREFTVDELPNYIREILNKKFDSKIKLLNEKKDAEAKKKFGNITDHVMFTVKGKSEKKVFYPVLNDDQTLNDLVEVPKTGHRTKRNQVTVQYEPDNDFNNIIPHQAGLDSAWGDFGTSNIKNSDASDISGDQMTEEERAAIADSLTEDDYQKPVKHYGTEVKEWADVFDQYAAQSEINAKKNDAALAKKDEQKPTTTEAAMESSRGIDAVLNSRARGETPQAETQSKSLFTPMEAEEGELLYLTRIEIDENGNKHVVTKTANWTPDTVRQSREQKAYVALNKKLREEILPRLGVAIGSLTEADARLAAQGITDFSKLTQINAHGLRELIRLAEGYKGEEALPEEFAHLALEMLGHDHELVRRLLNELERNERAMKEAFEGQYEEYKELYKDDAEKLRLEAAGKLLAKTLLREQRIETPETRPLIKRIIDAIKNFLRRIGSWQVFDAIMDANQLSSKLARDIMSGRLLDDMSLENISRSDSFAQVQKNLNEKQGLLNDILKRESKRLALLKKRAGPINNDQKSAAMIATEKQISILEDAIKNHKVESALVDYLKNSLQFLKDTEASLDNKVMYGDKVNTICRELNKVRDTLYSYASVMKLINDATESGEIIPSGQLTSIQKDVKDEMDKFMTKYERLGMRFFERMLANVYGEHGITRTLGKDRGKVLTIEEMARHGDRDISLATRLLSSIADCGDYVLAAFDDVTRKAKINGRQRAAEAHRRVVVAFDKLVRETGSKDQSFMFEMEKGEDGKMHRTGDYISNEKAKLTLSKPQYDFYKEMIAIKQDIDDCLPPALIKSEYRIVALRKFGFDRIKGADGIHGKLDAFGENVKNAFLDNSEEADKEERSVQVDFQGNKIDNLPIKYVSKGKNESWDDMTDDVAMSIIAYASMGYEYDELNQVLAMLENARYMSMNREIQQKSGWQKLVERVKTGNTEDDLSYDEPFTKKQMHTNIQKALDDFFQMHLYGKLEKQEGGLLGTRVSARKVSNAVNAAASYSQMAFNLQQRLSNVGAGMMNIAVETAGKGAFTAANFAWATKEYMKHSGRRILETGALESRDKLSLFAERYDLHQNNGKVNKSFTKSRASRTFNTNLMFAGLNMGEDFLALTTALAIAKNTGVKYKDANGNWKNTNLWDAFEVKYSGPDNTGAYLQIKDGYVMADGSPIDKQAEEKFAKLVIGTNFRLQGIYNSDDKSAIQQYAFGSLVMMYRKWMHPAIVRRYGKAGYNPLTGQEGEGYWRTVANWVGESFRETLTDEEGARVAMNVIQRVKQTFANMQLNKSKMTDYEKSNLSRALVEISTLMGICLALMLHSKFGPDKKKNEEDFGGWFDSMAVYQMFRLRNEMGSVAPSPLIFKEITNTLSSPIAAIEPMRRLLRIPYLLWPGTYTSKVKSGAFKGKSKAEKIIFELPILSLYKQIQHVIDPTPLINYYKNDLQF